MASTNQSPFYKRAETNFLTAQSDKERIAALEEMIKECPKHKSSEKMLANLKTRYIKLKEKIEKEKSKGKGKGKIGIKKESMQAVIVGKTKTGKSSLISLLTNAKPEISDYEFTTKFPVIGMMSFEGASIQLVENPSIESEFYDKGLTHTADTLLILVSDFNQIQEIEKELGRTTEKKIIVFNKIDLLPENEIRKISAKLQSKKYNFAIISTITKEGIEELKEKLFQSFDKIRVYTKEPGKSKSTRPMILETDSSVKDVAEKILKGFSSRIKETKIWGPSSKFSGQKVGLTHVLKDLDVVEFKTK
jgi:hypothetical protein